MTVTHRDGIRAVLMMLVAGLASGACNQAAPKPAAPALLGDLKATVSVKELMENEIDPIADNIFEAVGTDVTAKGVVETAPQNDADWAKVRMGGVTLAEAANLLKIPRPFAPAGDMNNSGGPNAPELSPDQITAKVQADLAKWNSHVEELRAVALQTLEIVKKKDTAALSDVGDTLDKVCENCHLEYWYPNDRKPPTADERKRVTYGSTGAPPQKKE